MRGLDFFVIGAQKGGTTTLWHLLRDHPQLAFASEKEAAFFADDRIYPRGVDWYTRTYFSGADPDAVWGTVTPPYMTGVSGPHNLGLPVAEVARRMFASAPEAKLIALLREPVQRAISHYRMAARRELEQRPLAEAIGQQLLPAALEAARARPSETNGYVVFGEYGRILAAYRAHFPAEQLMVALTEELEADPGGLLGRVLRFLGVDEEWRPEQLEQRHRVGGDALHVSEPDLAALKQRLARDVPEPIRGAVDEALDAWNTIAAAPSGAVAEPLASALREHFATDAARLETVCGVRVPWSAAPEARSSLRTPAVATPEVSIVILAHDTPVEVDALLASIVANTDGEYEIVLIDNGSSAAGRDAHAALAEVYGARLVALEDNLTFSVANNIGIQSATGSEIVLLNSDVVVTPGWLETLRTALHSASDIGAVGPRSNFAPAAQGGIWLDDSSPEGVDEFGRFFNHSDPVRWFDIDWLGGFAILARRPALEAVGGFDETLAWFAGEDISLSHMLQGQGWRTVCAGDTFVYHAGHHTFVATGANRSATRFGRTTTARPSPTGTGRLVVDAADQVFEVRDGVAAHFESWQAALMVKAGRLLEEATPRELEQLALAPPISLGRVRGTDEVFLLEGNQRRRVLGNHERIRRLGGLTIVSAAELDGIPEGPDVHIEDAFGPVPEIRRWLPSNPALISDDRLAPTETVAAEIEAALVAGQGYALIRLGPDEALVLNHTIWPAGPVDRARAGVRDGPWNAAPRLRRAIIGADAVGVTQSRRTPDGAALLEKVLFHYDLYPRLRCSASIGFRLRGIDPATRARSEPPLRALLSGKRVALVCPSAATAWRSTSEAAYRRSQGFDVRLMLGLDDMRELDATFEALAADRGAYDVVVTAGSVPTKVLCARLARELDVVALDIGLGALDDIVHPRLDGGRNELVALQGDVKAYLRDSGSAVANGRHAYEGKVVYAEDDGARYCIERGMARELTHRSLLALFDEVPVKVERSTLEATPLGSPLIAVHEPLTGPYVLLGGEKVPLRAGLPSVVVPDMALDALPTADRELTL